MKKTYIKWMLPIAWMIVIFYFSSMTAVVSNSKSRYVIYLFNFLGLNLNSVFGELANFIVRKSSHFLEYFILSLLFYNAVKDEIKLRKAVGLSTALTFIYACTDEFHQLFVSGRTGKFTDVLIDTCGGVLAMLIVYVLSRLRKTQRANE